MKVSFHFAVLLWCLNASNKDWAKKGYDLFWQKRNILILSPLYANKLACLFMKMFTLKREFKKFSWATESNLYWVALKPKLIADHISNKEKNTSVQTGATRCSCKPILIFRAFVIDWTPWYNHFIKKLNLAEKKHSNSSDSRKLYSCLIISSYNYKKTSVHLLNPFTTLKYRDCIWRSDADAPLLRVSRKMPLFLDLLFLFLDLLICFY